MKSAAISRFVVAAAIAALVVVGGSTAAWAACPTSPNFTPDFANQNCLATNSSGSLAGYPGFFSPAAPSGNVNPALPPPAGVNTVLRLTPSSTFQAGSAWFSAAQPVANPFSTTFVFQISNSSNFVADGFAFVIQNSSNATGALDPDVNNTDGCSLGFGDAPTNGVCTGTTGGITNSVAVAFDTYQNTDIGDSNGNHVEIQSCPMGAANSVEGPPLAGSCQIADNPNPMNASQQQVTLADGNFHTATISFAPSGTCTSASCPGFLHVILDNNDLFPSGVSFDIASIGLTNGTAYVGFTGATGGGTDLHDILSWTFTPQQQSGALTAGAETPTVLNYSGGPTNGTNGNTGYEYDLQLDATGNNGNTNPPFATGSVTAIVMDQKSCNKLVQKKFPLTQCFVFQNADGKGNSGAVLFELTCPGLNGGTSSQCGDPSSNDFAAALGTSFSFVKSQNPGFQLLNSTIGPYPGWLKGDGGTPGHPCAPPSAGSLFQSNQISSFNVQFDPLGTTKGKSGGSGSCWVATYFTSGELPPGIQISAPAFKTYKQNTNLATQGAAVYTCSNPSTSFKDPSGATGPYLSVASCTQNQAPNKNNTSSCSPVNGSPITCTGTFDISTTGLHVFTVTSKDTGGNVNANAVIYNVTK